MVFLHFLVSPKHRRMEFVCLPELKKSFKANKVSVWLEERRRKVGENEINLHLEIVLEFDC